MDWKLTRNLCGDPEVDQIHQTQAEEDARLGFLLMEEMVRDYDDEQRKGRTPFSPLKHMSLEPGSGLTEISPGVYLAQDTDQ